MSGRKSYPSDVTDEQWAIIGPELERATPRTGHGQPRVVDLREIYNTIAYQARSGCQWDMLPHDLLPKSTVYDYFRRWRDEGTLLELNEVLRKMVRQRLAPSGQVDPSAASIDSKSVPSTQACEDRGYDGGKKITGRKRNIAVDTLGLLLAVFVCVASVDDALAARGLMSQLDRDAHPRLKLIWVDNKYHNHALYAHIASHPKIDWKLEVVRRVKDQVGFVVQPKRWVVERTFAWQDRYRRLSKDYEKRTDSAESWVRITSINRMLRLLCPSPKAKPFNYLRKPQLATAAVSKGYSG